ncbi:MAG: response regulator [Succinivibrionaceae bacterium]|nr:response regulator [Succinivibrionaceae bacterium]
MKDHKENAEVVDFSRMSVFMLDDQESFQKMMKNVLIAIGFSSIAAASSAEAGKRLCNKNRYDMYLIDYNLGAGENGRQFIHYLHQYGKLPEDAVVLMVTGDASRAMVLSAIEEEPDDYLIKPFSSQQFRQRIVRCINRRNDLRDIYHAVNEKRYADAIRLCQEQLSRMSPYSSEIRIILTDVCIKSNEYQMAKSMLEEGLAFHESARFRLELGKVCYHLGEYAEALENLSLAKQMKPFLMEIYRIECSTYVKMGEYNMAEKAIDDAINISPQSSTLLRMQIDLAAGQHNYIKMRDCIGSLMELHKFEGKRLADLMSGFVHAAVLFASSSGERYHLDMLQKIVSSCVRRYSSYITGTNTDFSLEVFDAVSKARVDVTVGNGMKGKKALYRIINNLSSSVSTVPESIFSSIVSGLVQLGDYEYADNLQKSRKEPPTESERDSVLETCIGIYNTDESIKDKKEKYKSINRQGIEAYKNGNFSRALELFDEALRKSPTNTIAIINKAQSLLRLAQDPNIKKAQQDVYITSCQEIMSSLDGLPLSSEQEIHLNDIRAGVQNLKETAQKK